MSIAAGSYKRILQLLEKWPIDKNKAGGRQREYFLFKMIITFVSIFRDLAEHLKQYVDKAYKDNKFEADTKFWDRQYVSMKIILNNDHKNKYKRFLVSSATGLTAEQCNTALSNEFLKELAEEEVSLVEKYLPFFKKQS